MPNFRLARRPGRPHWYITWSESGRSRRVSTGTPRRDEAEIFLAQFIVEIEARSGRGPGLDADQLGLVMTLEAYCAGHADALPSAQQARIAARHLAAHFGDAPVAALTPAAQTDYVQWRRAAGISDETISRELSVARAALNWAVANRLLGAAPRILDLPRAPPRERVLSRAEAARLLDACRGRRQRHLALFVRLGLYTGARPSAILQLTWDRVDLGNRLVHFDLPGRAQTRKRRAVVPVEGALYTALDRARRRARSDWVIDWGGAKNASVKGSFATACARAGLDGVTPGTLRHTAASWAAMANAPLLSIGRLLGHTKASTTLRYAKYSPDYLRDVIRGIGRGVRPNAPKRESGRGGGC